MKLNTKYELLHFNYIHKSEGAFFIYILVPLRNIQKLNDMQALKFPDVLELGRLVAIGEGKAEDLEDIEKILVQIIDRDRGRYFN